MHFPNKTTRSSLADNKEAAPDNTRSALLMAFLLVIAPLIPTAFPTAFPIDTDRSGASFPVEAGSLTPRLRSGDGVVINELMPDPGFDFDGDGKADAYDEYIELYNPTDSQVSLNNCSLDDIESGGSSPYPLSGSIAPFSHYVLYRNVTDIAMNNNGEERVRLLGPDGRDIDNFTYRESEKNRSWGRRGDGGAYWTMFRKNTPGEENPGIPGIVINEFLPVPGGETTDEWIELYNAGDDDVNMTEWMLTDLDGNDLSFPTVTLGPGGYALVNVGSDDGNYAGDGNEDKLVVIDMNNPHQVLTDSGDDVLLCDDAGVGVDYVNYGNGSSIDGCPEELDYENGSSSPGTDEALALVPNGAFTDSASSYRTMSGSNITKGWNNSLPLGLIYPGRVSREIEGTAALNITIDNPTPTSSRWEVTAETFSHSFAVGTAGSVHIGATAEVEIEVNVAPRPETLPGTSCRIALNLTSALIPWVVHTVDLWVVLAAEVLINEIMIDAPGADSEGGEWIEIASRPDRRVNLTGWRLLADAGEIPDPFDQPLFVFPKTELDRGEVALVLPTDEDAERYPNVEKIFVVDETNVWTNTRGSVMLLTSAFTGADFLRWGDATDAPPHPDGFNGSCAVPGSGLTLARKWYVPDRDLASDFFIPVAENITPGKKNREIHSFRLDGPGDTNIVEWGSSTEHSLILANTGNMTTTFDLNLSWEGLGGGAGGPGWEVESDFIGGNGRVIDPPGQEKIDITITSPQHVTKINGSGITVDLSAVPREDPRRAITRSFVFQVPVMDLSISEMHLTGEDEGKKTIRQGDIVRIGTTVENRGPVNATGVNISLYVDNVSEANLIDDRHYEVIPGSLFGAPRHPSFKVDSLLFPGNRTFIIEVTGWEGDMDPENDRMTLPLNITPITPPAGVRDILIVEAYYYSYSEDEGDEYVELLNRGESAVDISGWQLIDDPDETAEEGLAFPEGTGIRPGEKLVVARNADELYRTIGVVADLDGAEGGCPEMEGDIDAIRFNDYSGRIVLRTAGRYVVDALVYGRENLMGPEVGYGWKGRGVPRVDKGYVSVRRSSKEGYHDTDTALDFHIVKQHPAGGTRFEEGTAEAEEIYFLPHGTEEAFSLLDSAEDEILISGREFTSSFLYGKIAGARERGVRVAMLLEGHPFGGIADAQRYYTEILYQAGAEVYYMDQYVKEGIYARYPITGANYIVVDGKAALLSSVPFTAEGVFGTGEKGLKGAALLLNDGDLFRQVFERDANISRPDITPYRSNHSRLGSPDPDYLHRDVEVPGKVYYGAPSLELPEGFEARVGVYPDISPGSHSSLDPPIRSPTHSPTRSPSTPQVKSRGIGSDGGVSEGSEPATDIFSDVVENAAESVYLLTDELKPLVEGLHLGDRSEEEKKNAFGPSYAAPGIPADPPDPLVPGEDGDREGGILLPHVLELLEAGERGVNVRILLDISNAEVERGDFGKGSGGVLAAARELKRIARRRSSSIQVRFDYLEGSCGIGGTLLLADNSSLHLSSAGVTSADVHRHREWVAGVEEADLSDLGEEFARWWEIAVPLERDREAPEEEILMTEIFYDSLAAHSPDQYVRLYNPGKEEADLSWWRLTDKQSRLNSYEGTLVFPKGTRLGPGDSLYVARKADAFHRLMTFHADFEYEEDTVEGIPELLTIKNFPIYAVGGDELFLVDNEGRTIDAVVYGTGSYGKEGWNGSSVPGVEDGDHLQRRRESGMYVDTDSALDFSHLRPYRPGQSDLKIEDFHVRGNVTAFVSPDTSFRELVRALRETSRTLYVNVYQFHNPHILDVIVNLSKDGVTVKVLLEGGPVGGVTDYQKYVSRKLNDSGAHVRYMISDRGEGISSRYTFDHAKYVVLDNRTVILLSENLKISGVPINATYGNRGWGIRVDDPALARYFADVFHSDFDPMMRDSFRYRDNHTKYGAPPEDLDMSYAVRKGGYMPRFGSVTERGNATVTPVLSPDTSSAAEGSVISMLRNAESSIEIQQLDCNVVWKGDWRYNWSDPENYYLNTTGDVVPNLYLTAAIDAARRGTKVRILLDSAFVWSWSRRKDNGDAVNYVNKVASLEGLDMVARLAALNGASGRGQLEKVHNKGAIVDGKKVLISSINWGGTSVLENREAGLIVENPNIAGYFRRVFDFDWNLTVFNYVSPYVIHAGNRSLTPGGSTQFRVALTYLNDTIPVSLRFVTETEGPLKTELTHKEMRIYPDETRELGIYLEADEEAAPGTDCRVLVRIELLNLSQDLLFLDLRITEKVENEISGGEAGLFDSVKNILTILLVALLIIIGAVARDGLMCWLDTRAAVDKGGKGGRGSEEGPVGMEERVVDTDGRAEKGLAVMEERVVEMDGRAEGMRGIPEGTGESQDGMGAISEALDENSEGPEGSGGGFVDADERIAENTEGSEVMREGAEGTDEES